MDPGREFPRLKCQGIPRFMMQCESPCVRIVEDEPAIRRLLELLILPSGFATRAYASAEQFVAEDRLSDPGCVLVDLELQGLGGAELVGWISRQSDPLPAIVVTGCGSVPAAVQCLKSGACDFLEKPVDPAALLEKVYGAIALDARQRISRLHLSELQRRYAALTPREREIAKDLSQGLSTKQIAARLGLSSKTVEHHRAAVMKKMQARSLAEVIRAMMDLGL